ncbi:MAG: hypothetical protein P8Y00_00320 [Deltaproteobacteria bacterium]
MTDEHYAASEEMRRLGIEPPTWHQVDKLAELWASHPDVDVRVIRIPHQGGQNWGARCGREGLCHLIGRSSLKNYEIWALLPGCPGYEEAGR